MSKKEILDRIQNYLENGGLFNPEAMEHDKVRDMILEVREYLYSLQEGGKRKARAVSGASINTRRLSSVSKSPSEDPHASL